MTTPLAGCATGSAAISETALCAGWRSIEYSIKHDTPETILQIKAHNLFGIRQGCWKEGARKADKSPADANGNKPKPL